MASSSCSGRLCRVISDGLQVLLPHLVGDVDRPSYPVDDAPAVENVFSIWVVAWRAMEAVGAARFGGADHGLEVDVLDGA